jgi:glycosyltransferase involved in cell wall biosynthesis
MNILLISPLCPLPLEKGGAVRIWNIAKLLSQKHDLDLVCFIRDERELKYESELKKVFKKVTFIKRKKLLNAQYLLSSLSHTIEFLSQNFKLLGQVLFSDRPLLSLLYDSSEMREFIVNADKSKKYDLLYAETFYSIACIKGDLRNLETPLLLIEQNIESAMYKRLATSQKVLPIKMFMEKDVEKIKAEEEYFWNSIKLVGGLSDFDCQHIKQKTKRDVLCVTNGVDVEFFNQKACDRLDDELLFVGSLQYAPNISAVRFLVDQVWPNIVSKLPLNHNLKLRIVGRGADEALKEYVKSKGFLIDESVEDIRTAFQHATILVAPLLSGSGTKYKVLESMASHLPVVTTSVGAEGLDVKSGQELYISDKAEELALDVVKLLNDADDRKRISDSAYEFVKNSYDWNSIVGKFNDYLESETRK